jgi:predicted dehydrogenase
VGCGKIADAHVEQVRATGRGEVVAVCDREPLMAEQLAVRTKVASRYTDFEMMLQSERLDIVHIATPPDSHVTLACMALKAGCHVFIEKPFALTAEQALIILDLARELGRCCCVNYLYNFETPGLELERHLAAGTLGKILHLETSYGYNLSGDYGLAVIADPEHWVHRLPGKLFHNVLDHVLAKVAAHLGDDLEVKALAFRLRPASGNPILDALADELRFLLRSGDVTVCGYVSAHGRPVPHTLRIVGSKDTLELDYAARTTVFASRQSQPTAVGRLFSPWVQARQFARNGWNNFGEFRRHEFHYFQGMRILLGRFYDAVEGRGPDPIPPEIVMRVCRAIDRVVASIGAGS